MTTIRQRRCGDTLPKHEVALAEELGWDDLTNGDLLTAAERHGFDLLITADKNIRYQQNLTGRKIGLIVLPTNIWRHILKHVEQIVAVIERAGQGRGLTRK